MADDVALLSALRLGIRPDDAYEIISNQRRRLLIRELAAVDETDHRGEIVLTISELADAISAAEAGISPDEVTRDHRRNVYVSLLGTHAPLLEEHGVITFYPRPKKIQAEADVEPLAQILEAIEAASQRGDDGHAL